ncbi:hypothetical protein HPP92_007164 [Vanilla planifolia]|uniref:Uncharacterized protein n=1 Tax=Vanilla planifolia TaxID=51239 RepID=A0A835VBL6_VANPL|nr:hypothetical protein HPP92_007164 [Vanilla planifolia]
MSTIPDPFPLQTRDGLTPYRCGDNRYFVMRTRSGGEISRPFGGFGRAGGHRSGEKLVTLAPLDGRDPRALHVGRAMETTGFAAGAAPPVGAIFLRLVAAVLAAHGRRSGQPGPMAWTQLPKAWKEQGRNSFQVLWSEGRLPSPSSLSFLAKTEGKGRRVTECATCGSCLPLLPPSCAAFVLTSMVRQIWDSVLAP